MKSTPTFGFSQCAGRSRQQPISYLLTQALQNPALISLAAGLVDYETLPGKEAAQLLEQILRDDSHSKIALQYGTTEGLKALRKRLLDHLAALDNTTAEKFGATIDDVIVSTGSQELLYLITKVLIDPGDIVITGWPSYFVYTSTLEAAGAEIRAVDMDENGVIPQALDETLARIEADGALGRVKIVYLVTYHQNPTGITLSAERKPQIVDIVKKYSAAHRILLLEDAAYRELTFEGTPPLSMKKYDPDNRYVAILQTFSKPFAPGFKTGYGILPSDLIEPVTIQKGNIDFGSANLCQHLLLEALDEGIYQRHVEELCRAYASKRDAMLAALDAELGDFHPADTHWTRPSGGLYVYLTLPGHINTDADGPLFARCIKEGVLYVPGEYCYGPDPTRKKPASTMRLSYGIADLDQIRQGIASLARAIKAIDAEMSKKS